MKYSSFMSKWKFDTDCPVVDNTFRALDRKHRSLNRFLSELLLPFSRHSYLSLSLSISINFLWIHRWTKEYVRGTKRKWKLENRNCQFGQKYRFGKSELSISTIEEETFAISTRGSLRWVFNFSIQHRDLTSLRSLKSFVRFKKNDRFNQAFLLDSSRKMLIHYLEMKFQRKKFQRKIVKLTYLIRIRSEYEIKRKVT